MRAGVYPRALSPRALWRNSRLSQADAPAFLSFYGKFVFFVLKNAIHIFSGKKSDCAPPQRNNAGRGLPPRPTHTRRDLPNVSKRLSISVLPEVALARSFNVLSVGELLQAPRVSAREYYVGGLFRLVNLCRAFLRIFLGGLLRDKDA